MPLQKTSQLHISVYSDFNTTKGMRLRAFMNKLQEKLQNSLK